MSPCRASATTSPVSRSTSVRTPDSSTPATARNGRCSWGRARRPARRSISPAASTCRERRNLAASPRAAAVTSVDGARLDGPGESHRRRLLVGRCVTTSTPLTTTGPSCTPTRSSRAYAVSTTSLTGVASGSVTSTTWHRFGSPSSFSTSSACVRTGPPPDDVVEPPRGGEEGHRVPRCRAVDDDGVPVATALELLDLAQHHDVVDTRCGGAYNLDHAARRETLGGAGEPVIAEVLVERGGCIDRLERETRDQLVERRLAVELDDEHASDLRRQPRERSQPLPWSCQHPLSRHHDHP